MKVIGRKSYSLAICYTFILTHFNVLIVSNIFLFHCIALKTYAKIGHKYAIEGRLDTKSR